MKPYRILPILPSYTLLVEIYLKKEKKYCRLKELRKLIKKNLLFDKKFSDQHEVVIVHKGDKYGKTFGFLKQFIPVSSEGILYDTRPFSNLDL